MSANERLVRMKVHDNCAGTLSNAELNIHEHHVFVATHLFTTVADAASVKMLVVLGSPAVHMSVTTSATGDGKVYLYESPTVSNNGTTVTAYDCNRRGTKSATASVYHTPTTSANGTELQVCYSGGGYKKAAIGSENKTAEWILNPSTTYMILFTNTSGANADISIEIGFIEH